MLCTYFVVFTTYSVRTYLFLHMRHKKPQYVDPQMTCLKTFMFVYVVSYGNVYVLNTTEVA